MSITRVTEGLDCDAEVFGNPDSLVPLTLVSQVLERCVAETACAHFGLLAGARGDARLLGLPGARLLLGTTLGEALSNFVDSQHANASGAAAYLHRLGDVAILGYGVYEREVSARDQVYATAAAAGCNIIRDLTGGAVRPLEVRLSLRQPPEHRPYAATLGVPVRFGQAESGIVLTRAHLATPVQPIGWDKAHQQELASSVVPKGPHAWTQTVRHTLRPMMLRGEVACETAADRLGVSLRTLTRRLAREGTNFQRVLDDMRCAVACELLELTDLRISEVADALSYSGHSPFVDAFRRWTGVTPSAWRRLNRSDSPDSEDA